MGLTVQVLGPVEIAGDEGPLPVRRLLERGLLVRLALAGGTGVADERLAADLWEGEDPGVARLRVVVSRLRRSLGGSADAVVRVPGGYRLDADVVDLRAAEAAAARLRADPETARAAAAESLTAWRGDALSDLRSLPFARREGERLDAWRAELTAARLRADLDLGAGPGIVTELARLAAEAPLDEGVRGMLATALYRAGRQADALAELAALRRDLARELGVDPTAETVELEVRLLRQDPALRPIARAAERRAGVEARPGGIVGREPELRVLADRLDAARSGEVGVVLVEGPPGIGRTRLLEALGELAAARGFAVRWGRAAEGAPAFWPWRQALRHDAGPLAPSEVPVPTAAPDDRFGLFETVVAHLEEVAGDGLVLLLDDLHRADVGSVLLLAHLAGGAGRAPLLVAACLRPDGLDPDRAQARTELLRRPRTTRIGLGGLTPDAVGALLALVRGAPGDPEVVASVAARTGGNPLFVRELAAAATVPPAAAPAALPTAIRDAVRTRLDALGPRGASVLAAAAVLGEEVDAELVADVLAQPVEDVLDRLDEAVAAGLLGDSDGVRFAQEIVREAVASDVGSGARARLHLRAAEHLERTGTRVPEIAHHRLAAVPLGDRGRAVRAAVAAAELAVRQFAFEDAVRLYDRAVGTGAALDTATRAELLLGRAHAQHLGHDVSGAMRSGAEAGALAEQLADPVLLARAAILLPDVADANWLTTSSRWCRAALETLPGEDGALRARLLAQLAVASVWADDRVGPDPVDVVGSTALAMAERVGDTPALLTALRARQLARSGPDGNHDRLAVADRMLALTREVGDPAELWGRLWRFDALVQLGRVDEAEEELDRLEPVVARLRRPLARWHLVRNRGLLLAARGRFPEARAAADEAVRVAARGNHRAAEYPAHTLRLSIALLTGDPVDPAVFEVERYQPPPRLLSMMAAEWHAAHGDLDEARRLHARLPRPETVPLKPFMVLPFHATGGAVAAAVGDAHGIDHAYAQLLPYDDLHVTAGAGAGLTGGSVRLVLGTLAAAQGRTDVAVDHLRAAVAVNEAAGLRPWAVRARIALARQLGDADASATAAAEATALGMPTGLRR
ncbi:BTAD domain-containing putative transcriptional regulator [Pseudonocardia sp. WMMC193]|uniref:BTAD domain-containing putative transcriptional regulator n=1 Tax=Pseudonocardia sp. WMMC193 TaxID=2911965 RepID=UPI001F20EF3C|nr:BTAD domain-containing putative transcriptional regulator [Pseudonocardia sp. WMMC193]MCF7550366.1 AAA family ATPase [Pseudonocardia sp. WMMC193]